MTFLGRFGPPTSNKRYLHKACSLQSPFDAGWDQLKRGHKMKDIQLTQLLVQIVIVYIGTGVFVFFTLVQ